LCVDGCLQLIRFETRAAIVGVWLEQCHQWAIFGVHRAGDNPVTATAFNRHHRLYFNLSRSNALT
jgi:hypothetical protein